MYSFYGGRPGNSFVIITTYRSVAEMVTNFKKGVNYTAVHYDQHVMINTVNKNDPDNGKIYRRGYDFTNDMGGAEYIGTIVGPAGKAPFLQVTTIADVKNKHAKQGYSERHSNGQYTPTNANLVPGKTSSGTFNDAITWECCSIRNENNEDATAYIGFTFPYPVIDYETESIEPYRSGRYADMISATRTDDKTHPFFEKWKIKVPKGVKGNAFKNLKVEPASSNIQYYAGKEDDVNNHRAIMAYDYYNYDDYQNGNPVRLYLGDYNVIDDVNVDDEGTITIKYTHDDDKVLTKKIKWVESISITNQGLLTIRYNHDVDEDGNDTTYQTHLDWIKEVDLQSNGTLSFFHTHDNPTVFEKRIKWCDNVVMSPDGTLTFYWNNGESTDFQKAVQWVSAIEFDNDSGDLVVKYNTNVDEGTKIGTVKWITAINIAPDGTVTYQWNTDEDTPVPQQQVILWPTDISVNSETQQLTVQWNNSVKKPPTNLGVINYILAMAVNENNHLLVKYSDPVKQAEGVEYHGTSGWTDLGQINQQYEYDSGSSATGLEWIGLGQLIDRGTDNKILKFTINPTAFINQQVRTIRATGGSINGKNSSYTISNLALTGATITKTLTGLEFQINSGIASTGTANTDFINLSITNMDLSFQ